jgi:dCMP deaminase
VSDETRPMIATGRKRPTFDQWAMELARVVATRATCVRRAVGCVLVDARGHVLATGYNGPPRGAVHCTDVPCAGARFSSGEGLGVCEAVHAEANALLQCPDVDDVYACYSTTEPCAHCAKLLLNTRCKSVIFAEPYPTGSGRGHWEKLRENGTWLLLSR